MNPLAQVIDFSSDEDDRDLPRLQLGHHVIRYNRDLMASFTRQNDFDLHLEVSSGLPIPDTPGG